MWFDYVFWAFFAFVLAHMAWRYFRSGSFTGAMLGGKIKREIGQASASSGSFSSQTLKVYTMESSDGESFIGMSLVSKAPLAASMQPIKLSKSQAQDLVQLLQQALA
ncbi:hypothetical protein [Dyella tabacisoli]|uniref:Uncharacterized protein n=1 Tax=Dyella tabacisoli TaxID=2282381 RepID=A0A369UHU3_9GAMM|nr:hypothetical protein [Dyella tabacisoli]RDD80057.1 hypothetical protein DVJ77_19490 [Dyella tabacisoli]